MYRCRHFLQEHALCHKVCNLHVTKLFIQHQSEKGCTFTASLRYAEATVSAAWPAMWCATCNLQLSDLLRKDGETHSWLMLPSSQSCISLICSTTPWSLLPTSSQPLSQGRVCPELGSCAWRRVVEQALRQQGRAGWHSSEPGCTAATPSCGNLLSLLPPLRAQNRYLGFTFKEKKPKTPERR